MNPELEYLTLHHNEIREIGSASLQFHPELISVDLSFNSVRRIQTRSWEHNTKITNLILANNNLVDLPDLTGTCFISTNNNNDTFL